MYLRLWCIFVTQPSSRIIPPEHARCLFTAHYTVSSFHSIASSLKVSCGLGVARHIGTNSPGLVFFGHKCCMLFVSSFVFLPSRLFVTSGLRISRYAGSAGHGGASSSQAQRGAPGVVPECARRRRGALPAAIGTPL